MSVRDELRLSGWALVLGAIGLFVASLLGAVLFPDQSNPTYGKQPLFVIVNLLTALAAALLLLGLPGLYARWRVGYGTLGLVGIVLLALTLMMFGVFFGLMGAMILPYIADQAPQAFTGPPPSFFPFFILGTVLSTVGPILLAVPMLRGRAPSRVAGWLLVISGVFALLSFFTSGPDTPSNLLTSLANAASPLFGAVAIGLLGLQLARDVESDTASRRMAPAAA